MASQVMAMPEGQETEEVEGEQAEGGLQPKSFLQLRVQRKGGGKAAPANFEQKLANHKGGGKALPDETRGFMESRFGADFGDVRVHEAPKESGAIGAQAFTHGNDIYFNSGKYNPGSSSGKELLAHELTHTIQQTGGKIQRKPNKVSQVRLKQIQRRTAEAETVEPTTAESEQTATNSVQSEAPAQQRANTGQPQTGPDQTEMPQGQTAEAEDLSATIAQNEQTQQETPETASQASNGTGAAASANGGAAGSPADGEVGQPSSDSANGAGSGAIAEPSAADSQATGAEIATAAAPGAADIAPVSPEADPDFQSAVSQTKAAAAAGKRHAPATTKAQEAQAAAVSPSAEITSKAQANQVGEMQQAETPGFDKAAFKAQLMEKIRAAAPKNLQEADEFKSNNQLGTIKGEMVGKVQEEKIASQQPLKEKAQQTPDTSGIEPKPVTPLPAAEVGQPATSVGAEKAVPKPRGQAEVETPLQQESQQIDQQMADAGVTDEQLAQSNEPQFQVALSTKQAAQTNAATAPQDFRQEEQGELAQAKTDAAATAQEKLQGMHGDRAQLLSQVTNQQAAAKGKDEQARTKVAGEIQKIYADTKGKVEQILSGIDSKVNAAFDAGAAAAQKAFEDYVDQRMTAYKDNRYSGVDGKLLWVRDKFLDLPSEVNVFYTEGRNLYIQQMDGVINQVVNIIAGELSRAKAEVANGRQQVQTYVAQLPQDLQAVGQDAASSIQGQFDSLEQSVDAKQDELIDSLAQKYTEKLQAVDARITQMKEANKGLVSKATDAVTGVIDQINKLKNMLLSVLKGAASAIAGIIKDPIGFLGNLISGIKQGFDNFVGNIWEHLQGGLIGWLTGAMGGIGLQMPKDIFSLPGIFDLVMQILGMTWNYVRTKAVKLMGEPVVAAAEKAYDVFLLLQEKGPLGLWEHVQDQFTDLKETVIGEIKNMVITQVITAGVKWILGLLNPASAFVKACMLIYDIVMFFVNQGSQVLSLMKAVIEGVKAIASGSVGAVAKAIEGALVKSLPVVIGFLASLLGIGGLTGKVKKIITKIRGRIDKAIDKILLKAKKLFKGKKGKQGQNVKASFTDGKKASKKDHPKLAAEAAAEMQQIKTKYKDYDSLRKAKQSQAKKIESKYTKKLQNGIKLTIKFDNPIEDKKDGDLDFKVVIAPNATIVPATVPAASTVVNIDLTDKGDNGRPSWRVTTKRELMKRQPRYHVAGSDGALKPGYDRRHIVAYDLEKQKILLEVNGKSFADAASIMTAKGYTPKAVDESSIKDAVWKYLCDWFNNVDNLWIGQKTPNSSKGSRLGHATNERDSLDPDADRREHTEASTKYSNAALDTGRGTSAGRSISAQEQNMMDQIRHIAQRMRKITVLRQLESEAILLNTGQKSVPSQRFIQAQDDLETLNFNLTALGNIVRNLEANIRPTVRSTIKLAMRHSLRMTEILNSG
ncbi:MAG: DUF4157 domain-containing protein [Elainellaceae cyanobacterium]